MLHQRWNWLQKCLYTYTYIVNIVVKVRASPVRELAVLANGVATTFSAPDLSIIT